LSLDDPASKKYDGLGYKNNLTNYDEPKHSMARLSSSGTFIWPPREERFKQRDVRVTCPDHRTSVVVKIEAFDLSDAGRNIPFYRREMTILDRVIRKPGIKAKQILKEYTKEQNEGVYPAMGQAMVDSLLEEMELMGYVEIRDGQVLATPKAEGKLAEFKASLSDEERKALNL
jgi:ribosomal protein S19E (S16A)